MSLRKSLKLKHELNSLELRIQQWGLKLESLIHDKESKQGEPLIVKEECHENHEVSCDLPPRFDELEVEEPQVSDLEPCEVADEIEELLCQEECPHLQQELRTILFEERGYDVYFQGYHFHSSYSMAWEASSKHIHARQGPPSVPLFEFHNKRHFMEFYLNFKRPFLKRCSSGQQVQQLGDPNHLSSRWFKPVLLLWFLSLGSYLSNKANFKSFGLHLPTQLSSQSSAVQSAQIPAQQPGFSSLITQA